MDIQQYYQNSAQSSLNGSLMACIPACFLVSYHSIFHTISGLLWWCLPFILYSVITYQNYLYTSKQAKLSLASSNRGKVNIFSQREFLIGFLPAPNLRLLLFHQGGKAVAEIRDLAWHRWRWFLPLIVDQWIYRNRYVLVINKEPFAIITLRKNEIHIEYNNKTILLYKESNKRFVRPEKNQAFVLQYALTFMHLCIQTENGKELARLQKGWIPREWMESYKASNDPILMINQTLTIEDQLIIYSIFIMYLKNVHH